MQAGIVPHLKTLLNPSFKWEIALIFVADRPKGLGWFNM
jgi:hypothetical protein